MKSLRGWFMTKRLLRIKYSLWEYKYVQSIQYNTATRCHKYHICSALNVKLGHPVLQTACCLHFISLACTQLSAPHLLITRHEVTAGDWGGVQSWACSAVHALNNCLAATSQLRLPQTVQCTKYVSYIQYLQGESRTIVDVFTIFTEFQLHHHAARFCHSQ